MKNIFVVGLDDFHQAQLQALPGATRYVFHPLFTYEQLKQQDSFPVARLLDDGIRILREFPEGVDAIVGYWDFPVSTSLPILRKAMGLPGPSLEAVLQCEHKFWSRVCQAEVVSDHVPDFCVVDPFGDDPLSQLTLAFPFWLKPVKSLLSHLGFHIADEDDFHAALGQIRQGIGRYAEPFNLILGYADLAPEIERVDGYHCIAEAIISAGFQCTQEGYVFEGEVVTYGTVDSLRCGPAQSSFSRYQYPSDLPRTVQDRMADISRRLMRHIAYDMGPFNIEYFWDEDQDRIWLLEVNTRISKSHAPLFHMVDGLYHHQVMVDLGLGRKPVFPQGSGDYNIAAKFMVRHFEDARVVRAPDQKEITAIQEEIHGTRIQVAVKKDGLLSELTDQDSYSYEIATIFVGAMNQQELEHKYQACMDRLPLRLLPVTKN